MKKLTVGLIGTLFVVLLSSNAGAHPSGFRVDLGGNGFGFSIYNNRPVVSPFWYNNYRHVPYYSGYYPSRPYLGWGGYRGHHHHNHKYWGQHKSGHRHKGHFRNYRRGHNHGGHKHYGKQNRRNHRGNQWRR